MQLNFEKIKEKISLYTLAKAMDVPPTTVYSWKENKKIPAWRVDNFLNALKKLGIDVSDCVKESGC